MGGGGDDNEPSTAGGGTSSVGLNSKHPDLMLIYPGIHGTGAIKHKAFMKINPIWNLWVQFCNAAQSLPYTTPPIGYRLGLYTLHAGIAIPVVNQD